MQGQHLRFRGKPERCDCSLCVVERVVVSESEQRARVGQADIDLVAHIRGADGKIRFACAAVFLVEGGVEVLKGRVDEGDGRIRRRLRIDEVAEHIKDRRQIEHIFFVVGGGIVGIARVVAHRHVQRIAHRAAENVVLRDGDVRFDRNFLFAEEGDVLRPRARIVHRERQRERLRLVITFKLFGGALRIYHDGVVVRGGGVVGHNVLKEVLRHPGGGGGFVEQIHAHDAVGYVRKGELGVVHGRLAVLHFEFEHAARLHVLFAELRPERGHVVVGEGAVVVQQDQIAHVLRVAVFCERIVDLIGGHADARGEPHAHEHHQDDGDEPCKMAPEHAPECL